VVDTRIIGRALNASAEMKCSDAAARQAQPRAPLYVGMLSVGAIASPLP